MHTVWLPVSYIWGSSRGQAADTSPHWTIIILSPTMVNQAGPLSTALNSGLLSHTQAHTRTHTELTNAWIPAADPVWCLISPHFSRPLLLSNWSSSEYNYSENHPGLMWGRINGIKKIICWPSGPATVWGWEGNLKQGEVGWKGEGCVTTENLAWLVTRGITFYKTPHHNCTLPLTSGQVLRGCSEQFQVCS